MRPSMTNQRTLTSDMQTNQRSASLREPDEYEDDETGTEPVMPQMEAVSQVSILNHLLAVLSNSKPNPVITAHFADGRANPHLHP